MCDVVKLSWHHTNNITIQLKRNAPDTKHQSVRKTHFMQETLTWRAWELFLVKGKNVCLFYILICVYVKRPTFLISPQTKAAQKLCPKLLYVKMRFKCYNIPWCFLYLQYCNGTLSLIFQYCQCLCLHCTVHFCQCLSLGSRGKHERWCFW